MTYPINSQFVVTEIPAQCGLDRNTLVLSAPAGSALAGTYLTNLWRFDGQKNQVAMTADVAGHYVLSGPDGVRIGIDCA